jgi:hypothetical protein
VIREELKGDVREDWGIPLFILYENKKGWAVKRIQ